MPLIAHYFDGQSSRRQSVRLSACDDGLLIEGEDGTRTVPLANIRVSEPQGRAPRTLRFEGAGFCEVAQGAELDALLDALGHRETVAVRLQKRWRWAIGSFVAVALVMVAGYLWGLPWGAKVLAPHVPVAVMREISDEAMEQLDKYLFVPTKLPEARRQKLEEGFRALAATDPLLAAYGKSLSLNFRASPKIGPNAFALPDGKVVLLDELVNLLGDDEAILAVLAHELGHLDQRHGIRQLIQSSAVAAVTALWFGDISYAVAAVSTAVLESGYSRDMEREADAYAADMLRRENRSPALLADALAKLEAFYEAKTVEDKDEKGKGDGRKVPDKDKKDDGDGRKVLDWLSSHPDTAERIRLLRAAN